MQAQIIAAALIALALTCGGFYAGQRWADSAHARDILAARDRYDALAAQVREQNRVVQDMATRTEAATAARNMAQRLAEGRLADIRRRLAAFEAYQPTDCDDAMRALWGAR